MQSEFQAWEEGSAWLDECDFKKLPKNIFMELRLFYNTDAE